MSVVRIAATVYLTVRFAHLHALYLHPVLSCYSEARPCPCASLSASTAGGGFSGRYDHASRAEKIKVSERAGRWEDMRIMDMF